MSSVEVEIFTKEYGVTTFGWHMQLERFPISINYKS